MSQPCCVCGIHTIFYIWTSTRNFPREKLEEIHNIKDKEGRPICFKCRNEMMKHEKI
jgi:hypothetical protein